jgi:hypothetical protein
MSLSPSEARRQLDALQDHLARIVKQDPEQEVQGIAIPVFDAVVSAVKALLPDNPIVDAISDIISVETIQAGEAIRAVDALLVVNALFAAFPRSGPAVA